MGIVTDIAGVSDSSPGGLQSSEDQAVEGGRGLCGCRELDEAAPSGVYSIVCDTKACSGLSATEDEDGRGFGP